MTFPTLSVYRYDVIGRVTVMEAEVASEPVIKYSGPVSGFFVMADGVRPAVKTNRSAVTVTVTNFSGAVKRIFTALIKSVRRYSIIEDTVNIEFYYEEIPTEAVSGNVYKLEPVATALLKAKSYLFIAYEGDHEYVMQWASDNLKIFSHGNNIYRLYGAFAVKDALTEDASIADERLVTKTIILACQDDIPNASEFYDFYVKFCRMSGDIAVSYDRFIKDE